MLELNAGTISKCVTLSGSCQLAELSFFTFKREVIPAHLLQWFGEAVLYSVKEFWATEFDRLVFGCITSDKIRIFS